MCFVYAAIFVSLNAIQECNKEGKKKTALGTTLNVSIRAHGCAS